jgi:hypothetical protein
MMSEAAAVEGHSRFPRPPLIEKRGFMFLEDDSNELGELPTFIANAALGSSRVNGLLRLDRRMRPGLYR